VAVFAVADSLGDWSARRGLGEAASFSNFQEVARHVRPLSRDTEATTGPALHGKVAALFHVMASQAKSHSARGRYPDSQLRSLRGRVQAIRRNDFDQLAKLNVLGSSRGDCLSWGEELV